MPRTLYTPRLSDDVVRALYREALRRRRPMTVVADTLLRQSLGLVTPEPTRTQVREDPGPRDAARGGQDNNHAANNNTSAYHSPGAG